MRILQKTLTLHKDFQMPSQVETSRIKIWLLGSHFGSVSFDLELWLTFLFYSSHRQVNHSGKVCVSTSNMRLVRLNSPNLFHLPLRPKTPGVTKIFCQHNICSDVQKCQVSTCPAPAITRNVTSRPSHNEIAPPSGSRYPMVSKMALSAPSAEQFSHGKSIDAPSCDRQQPDSGFIRATMCSKLELR